MGSLPLCPSYNTVSIYTKHTRYFMMIAIYFTLFYVVPGWTRCVPESEQPATLRATRLDCPAPARKRRSDSPSLPDVPLGELSERSSPREPRDSKSTSVGSRDFGVCLSDD